MKIIYSRKERGFTLIELIIVLAVFSIIALIAVPRYLSLTEQARIHADIATVKILNKSTELYVARNGINVMMGREGNAVDVFDGSTSENDCMQILVDSGLLDRIYSPQKSEEAFLWNEGTQIWYYSYYAGVLDEPLSPFVQATQSSELDYEVFLSSKMNFSSADSTKYKPDSWNGYLEKLFETGNVESNDRVTENEGSNTIDYFNPYSNQGTVVNYNNWRTIVNNYPTKIPPAILITSNADFNHESSSSFIKDNIETLKGTMVFYKHNNTSNDLVQVYQIQEDGSLSELIPIEDVLP